MMTARIWEGYTKIEQAAVYTKIIVERDIPNYRETEGFVKLNFLKRSDTQYTYFKLITVWENLEVIKNFTGSNFEKAVAYTADAEYLVDFPGSVMHYEVFAE
ncbi:antibiotic biosynthesis monooxygenase [Spongiimicrobium salis]|uniref:antibiotic biosynthesis monooxygenase n=1 Tax=Spongiimicrobium salis TaxID=1667022 RepID=UPI00374CA5BC